MVNHRVHELLGSELAALVGVDYVRTAEPGIRFLQRLDRMHGLQRDRHSVRQNPPTVQVNHRHQVHKATRHANVGRIKRPDLVAALDCQLAKQVRKHLVLRVSTTSAGLRRRCRNTHLAHQRADAQPARIMALPAQCATQLTRAHEREQVQPVYRIHQHQIPLAGQFGQVIHRPSTDIEQLGLTFHAQRYEELLEFHKKNNRAKTKESIDLHRLLVIENHFSSYLSNKYGNNFRALSFSIASPNGSYNSLSYRS